MKMDAIDTFNFNTYERVKVPANLSNKFNMFFPIGAIAFELSELANIEINAKPWFINFVNTL